MNAAAASWSALVIGAGGNIGSHLVPLVARQPGLARLVLVDPDSYEERNLDNQSLVPRDVGRAKARVQAARARKLRPELAVEAIVAAVEQVPLGRLRADWILACVDSRSARQSINEAARRLGRPWLDAGVEASQRLARVTLYGATAASACLECRWDERDYAALEQSYPCVAGGGLAPTAPTAAPAELGALAAALQALECGRRPVSAAAAERDCHELVLAAGAGRLWRSRSLRRADCRLPEHRPWTIVATELDPAATSLQELLTLGAGEQRAARARLAVAGRRMSRHWHCPRCGRERELLRLFSTLRSARCTACGGALVASGYATVEELDSSQLSARERKRSLSALGCERGDVVSVRAGGRVVRLEIGSDRK